MTKQNKILSGILAAAVTIAGSVAVINNLASSSLQKIDLPIEDAYVNQHFKDDFNKLVDGNIKTRFTQWSPRVVPYQINFPFYDYDTVAVKQIKFRYNNGGPSTLKFYYINTKGEKVLMGGWAGGSWDSAWKVIDFPNATAARSFIIESKGGDDFPDDIEIYGNYKEATPVSGKIQIVPSASGQTSLDLSLPVSTNNFSDESQAAGVGSYINGSSLATAKIYANASTQTIKFVYRAPDTAVADFFFTFSYTIQ